MWDRFRMWGSALATTLVCNALASPAAADVHLELRPAQPQVDLGDTVRIGLYAVSDQEIDQAVGGIDAIVSWDPRVLTLAGHEDDGPYTWMFSWFPNDIELDRLNDTWSDGDAWYQSLRRGAPNPPAMATADGLLVTTLVFTAVGPATVTRISLIPEAEFFTKTRVLDGLVTGRIITGQLVPGRFSILLCGPVADLDDDCDVDSTDFEGFSACLDGPDGPPLEPVCQSADLDDDGDTDLRDYQVFQMSFTGR